MVGTCRYAGPDSDCETRPWTVPDRISGVSVDWPTNSETSSGS